jgi:peptide/nickel transport system substrate-binding protein
LTQSDAAFADVKSRQALQYGVDWNNLVKTLYPNQSGAVINSGVPSGQPHHDPKILKYKFDPAKAKALLKAANFDYSKTIRLRYYNADQTSVNFMTAVAQQLIDLGLKVDVLKFQGDATTELYTTRNYDLALKGLSAFSVAEWFGEYAATATFGKIIGDQPDFIKLTSALAQSTTLRATGTSLASLQALEQKTLLKMPLYLIKQTVYVSKRISGLPSAFGNPLYMYDNSLQNWVAR